MTPRRIAMQFFIAIQLRVKFSWENERPASSKFNFYREKKSADDSGQYTVPKARLVFAHLQEVSLGKTVQWRKFSQRFFLHYTGKLSMIWKFFAPPPFPHEPPTPRSNLLVNQVSTQYIICILWAKHWAPEEMQTRHLQLLLLPLYYWDIPACIIICRLFCFDAVVETEDSQSARPEKVLIQHQCRWFLSHFRKKNSERPKEKNWGLLVFKGSSLIKKRDKKYRALNVVV